MSNTETTLAVLLSEKADFWAIDKQGRKWVWKSGLFFLENGDPNARLLDEASFFATSKDGKVWKSRNEGSAIYDLIASPEEKKETSPTSSVVDSNNPLQVFRYGRELNIGEFYVTIDPGTGLENITDGAFGCPRLPKKTEEIKKEPSINEYTGEQLRDREAYFWAIDERGDKWILPGNEYGRRDVTYIREKDASSYVPDGMEWSKTIYYAKTPDNKVWVWDDNRDRYLYLYQIVDKQSSLTLNEVRTVMNKIEETPSVEALIGGYQSEEKKEDTSTKVPEKGFWSKVWDWICD